MTKNYPLKPKIIFLLGYPRSGSTVFGEVFGKVKGILHVGEMERLFYPRKNKEAYRPQKECSCGKMLYDCNFWEPYFDKLEIFLKELDGNNDLDINTKSLCAIKEDIIQKGDYDHPKAKIYGKVLNYLCAVVQESTGEIILDTSKELWYAKFLESTNLFEISYIHLIRDVRGVVYSRQKKLKEKDEQTGMVSLNLKYMVYDTLRWNMINFKMHKFLKNKKSIEVDYHQFVEKSNSILQQISEKYGLSLKENLVNEKNEFIIEENHLIHGNRFRFERGVIKLLPDGRWKKELKERDKRMIKLLSWFRQDGLKITTNG